MSDGRVTPENLVFKASARNLDLIAVTDHDTTAGVAAAQAEGEWLGVKVIPGVELSASAGDLAVEGHEGRHVHLICLGFDPSYAPLQVLLEKIRQSREKAGRETLERLSLAGYEAELPSRLGVNERALCRPHLADALIRAGHARNRNDAFDRFLASDTYRSPYSLPPVTEAIEIVHAAGGIAIYAHPSMDEIDELAPRMKEAGLDGIEVFRAAWPRSPRGLYIEDMARRLDLMVAGGSDWHGVGTLGDFALTREVAGPLVERVA